MTYLEITLKSGEKLVLGVLQDHEIDVSYPSGSSNVVNMAFTKSGHVDILIKKK